MKTFMKTTDLETPEKQQAFLEQNFGPLEFFNTEGKHRVAPERTFLIADGLYRYPLSSFEKPNKEEAVTSLFERAVHLGDHEYIVTAELDNVKLDPENLEASLQPFDRS